VLSPVRSRILTAAVLLALVTTLSGCDRGVTDAGPPGPITPVTPAAGAAPGGAVPALVWEPCAGGMECASLTVPVDHDRPDGPTIDLAVARRRAADPAHRIGSVVLNPGGPGGSGLDLVQAGAPGADAMARFDIVSWDPRGTGASAPLACDETVIPYRALDWSPDDRAETASLDEGAERIARDCRASAGELAPHLATRDSARDLDRLRAALGEERLTFVGYSYGTALGLHHARLFPDRVRALVLDGVSDPRDDLATALMGQARALEVEVDGALGDRVGSYDRVMRAAEAGTGPVDPTTVAYAAVAASYQSDSGGLLRTALSEAEAGRGEQLRALAGAYWAASAYGPYFAVTCSDLPHPAGSRDFDGLVGAVDEVAPRFGAVIVNEMRPCAWWPTTAPVPSLADVRGTPPILVLGNTGDVATPYANAVRVADALDPAALLTYVGSGHTSLGRSACVDREVRRYLEEVVIPPVEARCR
jgi:pimeloyl-ACP methyl ester carboxylesterase